MTLPAASPAPTVAPPAHGLAHLPISLFAAVMGFAGTSAAWRRAAVRFSTPVAVADILAWTALGVFAVLVVAYGAKVALHFTAAVAEWKHPVKMAFVPAVTIALIVLAGALYPLARGLAEGLWWVGAIGHLALTLAIIRLWIATPTVRVEHVHPGWFMAPVGNIIAPIVGVHVVSPTFAWFLFAVGIVYWIALLPIVLYRLIALDSMPPRLLPTLAIMIAPPAIGSVAWVSLGGTWTDPMARILLGVAVFQAMLLVAHATDLWRVPFGPSVWAYTFPLAALTIGLVSASEASPCRLCAWAAVISLVIVSLVVLAVTTRTVIGLFRWEICQAEPAPAPAPA